MHDIRAIAAIRDSVAKFTQGGTKPTCAVAAIADAAFYCACGKVSAAIQPHSPKRPFNLVMKCQSEIVCSPRGDGTIETRDEVLFRYGCAGVRFGVLGFLEPWSSCRHARATDVEQTVPRLASCRSSPALLTTVHFWHLASLLFLVAIAFRYLRFSALFGFAGTIGACTTSSSSLRGITYSSAPWSGCTGPRSSTIGAGRRGPWLSHSAAL